MIFGRSDIEGPQIHLDDGAIEFAQKVPRRRRELNTSEKADEIGLFRNPISETRHHPHFASVDNEVGGVGQKHGRDNCPG
jgi:hypothetical protein